MFSDWGLSWGGWMDNRRGEWWLLAQLLLIAAHLLPPTPASATWGLEIWPRPLFLLGAVLLITGLALAGLAFKSLGSSLSPLPTPKPGNQLILNGPYRRCRHPMYQAVLVCSLGMVVAFGSLLHLLLLVGLVLVLGGKARREEQALTQLHSDYALYRSETSAIVPNVPWLDWRS
ncbi:MAG: S-isoprenylcysteine methyltransferase [Cyanobium sp. MED843]|nr:S-isoprenylcysteine methyltransferase [Cyanobium sp. MED843]MAV13309.1 S-isoprenylcysteine methyltransferase [Cyanobium sp. MED843]OUW28872.1 MAG: S-isoprenylcysteine methyltransferase [Cyanobacteria bacterium TMED177]